MTINRPTVLVTLDPAVRETVEARLGGLARALEGAPVHGLVDRRDHL